MTQSKLGLKEGGVGAWVGQGLKNSKLFYMYAALLL